MSEASNSRNGTDRVISRIRLGAIALALSLTTALPVEVPYAAGLVGSPAAQAGVWDSVKGAAKKVGSAAKTVGKKVGAGAKAVGKQSAGLGKEIGKAAGEFAWNGVVVPYGKVAGGLIVYPVAKGVVAGAKAAGRGVKSAAVAVGNGLERATRLPKPPSSATLSRPKLPASRPGSWGGNGRRSETVAIRKSTVARDKSVWGRPIGGRR